MALGAAIFDIDGTLVDSNDLHCEAWRRAFLAHDYRVDSDRIEIEIGKGGDQLVPAILGPQADRKDGDSLRKQQPKEFEKLAVSRGLQPFKGAFALIDAMRARGLQIVFATSSSHEQLATLERASGIDLEKYYDQIATGDDAKKSKPHPDIVIAAVKKSGLSPAQCALIGDTSYDMRSARDAGVIGMGVRTGFQSEALLMQSGARRVWPDVAHILSDLDRFLHCASPTKIQLTSSRLEQLMSEALKVAEQAMRVGEAPIACVLADGDGEIFARGFNQLNRTHSRVAHAEMVTFADAATKRDPDAGDLILATTLEPCVMCLGAIMQSGVDTVVYGLRAPADSGTARVTPPESPDASMPRLVGGVLGDNARALFKKFLHVVEDQKQRAFVKQLLSRTA